MKHSGLQIVRKVMKDNMYIVHKVNGAGEETPAAGVEHGTGTNSGMEMRIGTIISLPGVIKSIREISQVKREGRVGYKRQRKCKARRNGIVRGKHGDKRRVPAYVHVSKMSLGSNICDDVFKGKLGEGKSPDRSTGSNQPAMDSGEEQKSVAEKSVDQGKEDGSGEPKTSVKKRSRGSVSSAGTSSPMYNAKAKKQREETDIREDEDPDTTVLVTQREDPLENVSWKAAEKLREGLDDILDAEWKEGRVWGLKGTELFGGRFKVACQDRSTAEFIKARCETLEWTPEGKEQPEKFRAWWPSEVVG
ncbi:unnamed protein product, partial [Allacma fusca]